MSKYKALGNRFDCKVPGVSGENLLRIIFIFCFFSLSGFWNGFLLNADEEMSDNTGAAFLIVAPFPRASGMGNAFTGVPGDISSLYFNPAGLVLTKTDIMSSTHCEWFQHMRFENLALSHNMKERGALGVNIKGFYTGGLEKRTGDTQEPEGTFGAYFIDFGVSYSKSLLYYLPVGFTIKGIYEKIGKNNAFGAALDFGLLYRTAVNGLQFGFSLKNLGSDMQFVKEKFKLPGMLRIGMGYRTMGGNLLLSADIEKTGQSKASLSLGSELLILKTLSLRFGMNGAERMNVGSKTAGLSLGAGFVVGNLSIDYAFVNYDYLGMTHRFGLTFKPGVSEEERKKFQQLALQQARKSMLEKEKMMSSMYLEKGKELVNEERYDDAIDELDIALVWDPGNTDAQTLIKTVRQKKKEKEELDIFKLGQQAFNSGNFLEAVRQLNKVLELNPNNKNAIDLRDEAKNKLSEQSKKLAVKTKKAGSNVQTLFTNGVQEYTKSHYKNAISKWQKVLAIDPTRQDARLYIAKAQEKINKQISALSNKLKLFIKKKDWLSVISTAKEIKSLAPSNKEAINALNEAKAEIAKIVQTNLNKAKRYYAKGDTFSSEEHFRIVLRYEPNNKEAKNYIKKIEKSAKEEDADKWYLKGIDAYTKNQFKLAISYWERCLSIDPKYGKAEKNIQRAKKKLQQLEKSE